MFLVLNELEWKNIMQYIQKCKYIEDYTFKTL